MAAPHSTTGGIKYRSSCDRCQDNKVKCGQEKPECDRCAKKSVPCIYSPIRTMGRPRKSQPSAANSTTTTTTTQKPLPSEIPSHNEILSATTITPEAPQDPTTTSTSPINHNIAIPQPADHPSPLYNIDLDLSSIDTPPSTFPPSSSGGHEFHNHLSISTQPSSINNDCPSTSRQPPTSCYTSILSRTIKLEQTLLSAGSLPIGLEAVFKAEQDFRNLKTALFTCPGGHYDSPQTPSPPTPCLSSYTISRLSLTSLVLYAERVAEVMKDCIADFQPYPGSDQCSTRCEYFGVNNFRVLRAMDYHALRVGSFYIDEGSEVAQRAISMGMGVNMTYNEAGPDLNLAFPQPWAVNLPDDGRSSNLLTPGEARALRRIFKLRTQKFRAALVDIKTWAGGEHAGGNTWEFMVDMVGNLIRRMEILEQILKGGLI